MRTVIYILVVLVMTSCEKKEEHWSDITIDDKISSNPIYNKMNNEEFASLNNNKNIKRTSDVVYSIKGLDKTNELSSDYSSKAYNCTACFNKSDMLTIDIGTHGMFGGRGLTLQYCNKKFSAHPYEYVDVILENTERPKYKTIRQKLTLNKSKYTVGDSLYGSVEFRIIETTGNLQTRHAASGFFRTKITIN